MREQSHAAFLEERGVCLQTHKHYEGLFTQGSGFFHVRGSLEEGLPSAPQNESYMRLPANVTLEKPRHPYSKYGVYIPNVTGRHPLLNEVAVNLPYFLGFTAQLDGVPLSAEDTGLLSHNRKLDLTDGALYRTFTWQVPSGSQIQAAYRRTACRHDRRLFVQEMSFICRAKPCHLVLESFMDCDVKTNGYDHFTAVECRAQENLLTAQVETDMGNRVAIASRTQVCSPHSLTFTPVEQSVSRRAAVSASLTLQPDETVVVTKISALQDDGDAARVAALLPPLPDADVLFAQSRAAWDALWQRCAVEVEGDDALNHALKASLYHLLRAANPDNDTVSICAKGFAGEAYFGHFFWDTEVYMMPFFLYTHPDAAKALASFRLNTLEGARANARAYGAKGAKYPWESSVSGAEQCPNWQYADNEIHINADVVYGLWHYYKATGDDAFWLRCLPVLVETARYWTGRVTRNPDGSLSLQGVMGPDEYICFCRDNVYTNQMALFALTKTLECISYNREHHAAACARLETALALTQEDLDCFAQTLSGLSQSPLPGGVIPQCSHFDEYETVDFARVWPDRSKHFGQVVSQEYNYRTKALKQADLLMLPFLFRDFMPREQLQENFDYYLPLTTHDSSLSYVVHATLAFWLNRPQEGSALLQKALDIDLDVQKGGASEGIHIANCGGLWQAVVLGLCGLRRAYEGESLSFSPCFPEHIHSITLRLVWKGAPLTVRVTPSDYEIL